ncbi:MAG TPA: hypothetical protein VGS19_26620 [Streptosporangiaceae bacterium]|nr:hypothetical protein [Streptosporangiaceae bacterium]
MAVLTLPGADRTSGEDPGVPVRGGRPAARTTDMAGTDRSAPVPRRGRAVRSWPLLVLAAPAAAEVWSGWVGIAQKTGFGLVSPLPGIWPSLHLDTTITLPVGVEAYAAYALRAWLASEDAVSRRTRRFAKYSAVFSFALGMAGQVTCHLLAQAGATRAPWAITTVVSCLPVLVLAMGTALAHMLHDDAATADSRTSGQHSNWSSSDWSAQDHTGAGGDQSAARGTPARTAAGARTTTSASRAHSTAGGTTGPVPAAARPGVDQARLAARRLADAGIPLSRRSLRSSGVRGSNEALNALARTLNAELAGTAAQRAPLHGAAGPPGQAQDRPGHAAPAT